MISKTSRLVMFAATLLTLAACDPHPNQGIINHGIDPKKVGPQLTSDDQKVQDLVKSFNQGCLPVAQIVEQWTAEADTGFTIYTQDRDLISGLVSAKTDQRYDNDYIRFQTLIANNKTALIENKMGSELLSSSQVGALLNLDPVAGNNCVQVRFTGNKALYTVTNNAAGPLQGQMAATTNQPGRAQQRPVVPVRPLPQQPAQTPLPKAPATAVAAAAELDLVSPDDGSTIVYRMVGATMEITVKTPATNIPACDPDAKNMTIKTRYIIIPGTLTPSNLRLRTRFADLLANKALSHAPQAFKDMAKKQMDALTGADNAKSSTTRPKTDNFFTPISLDNLILVSQALSNGQTQTVQCKTTPK